MLNPDSEYPLKKIDPRRLLGEKKQEDVEGFFLVLAVIYNDLKGVLHLQKDFLNTHDVPSPKIDGYSGEYNGMMVQFDKTLAGIINELLRFLEVHEDLYRHPKFKRILRCLPERIQKQWFEILEAALDRENKDQKGLGYKLMLIRNHVTSHYYKSEQALKDAFSAFFGDPSVSGAEFAYYALGENMSDTRFFYADAAVQYYIMKTANAGDLDFKGRLDAYNALQKESFELLQTTNMVLANLLRQFITEKHNERSK